MADERKYSVKEVADIANCYAALRVLSERGNLQASEDTERTIRMIAAGYKHGIPEDVATHLPHDPGELEKTIRQNLKTVVRA